ncbi:MAG TPA: hemolysin III family protein [Gaiellaceae bacterium]|nr:hemolysin III family protein [Gaiellaceae bacterium]
MASRDLETVSEPRVKPRLRGASHQYAFILALVGGTVLVAGVETTRARAAVGLYALSVLAMFGSSALYHRITWPPAQRRKLRRLDHAMIYFLIAGTYTPFGTLALSGGARILVLTLVWAGALAGIVLAFTWSNRPEWVEVVLALALGWIGVVVLPELVDEIGLVAVGLVLAGGVFYTAGSLVYARRRPDPIPAVFGYHELFHALVVIAVVCQYAAIASFVL